VAAPSSQHPTGYPAAGSRWPYEARPSAGRAAAGRCLAIIRRVPGFMDFYAFCQVGRIKAQVLQQVAKDAAKILQHVPEERPQISFLETKARYEPFRRRSECWSGGTRNTEFPPPM
jgi:hypothetical protein